MNLKEFRAAYPQYNDLDDYTLTTKLHKKFYADMDFGEFSKRVEYGPFDPGAGLAHEEQRLKQVGGQPQGFIEKNIAPTVDIAKNMGGQIRTGLERVGTPFVPGMLTEAESARPPMPLVPAHETPLPYPDTLQAAHQPPNIGLEQLAAEAKQIQQEEGPDPVTGADIKEMAMYPPYLATAAVRGLMQPVLDPLATLGMPTEDVLNTALEYYRSRITPEVAIPDFGLQGRLPDAPVRDILGGTAEATGFVGGPVNVAGKASGLVTQKLAGKARPFFQHIARGMGTGALLGEGKKDETLANMALFGVFEGTAHLINTVPAKIANSTAWRRATIKERGLVVQSLDDFLKNNPKATEGQIARQYPEYFKRAEAERMKTERPITERPAPETVTPEPETVTASESYIRKNNLPEARRKLETLKQRYAENGIEGEIPKVEKAIAAIDEVMAKAPKEPVSAPVEKPPISEKPVTEAPAEAAPEPDQVTPFPGQRPGQPKGEPKFQVGDKVAVKVQIGKGIWDQREGKILEIKPSATGKNYYEVETRNPRIAGGTTTIRLPEKDIQKWKGRPLTADELKARGKEIDTELDEAVKAEKEAEEKDIDIGEGEPPLEPKQQKRWLLSEVDKAIKKADGDGTITFHVPGDGEFTILNDKSSLEEFKKRAEKFYEHYEISKIAERDYPGVVGVEVEVKGLREKTGEEITVKMDAGEALAKLDTEVEHLNKLLECLKK